MADEQQQIMGALGELRSSVKTLLEGQKELFDFVRQSHGRTSSLESEGKEASRRLERIETTQEKHANELAETRGANRTNRWLVVVFPPIVLAFWETVKGFLHLGGTH